MVEPGGRRRRATALAAQAELRFSRARRRSKLSQASISALKLAALTVTPNKFPPLPNLVGMIHVTQGGTPASFGGDPTFYNLCRTVRYTAAALLAKVWKRERRGGAPTPKPHTPTPHGIATTAKRASLSFRKRTQNGSAFPAATFQGISGARAPGCHGRHWCGELHGSQRQHSRRLDARITTYPESRDNTASRERRRAAGEQEPGVWARTENVAPSHARDTGRARSEARGPAAAPGRGAVATWCHP